MGFRARSGSSRWREGSFGVGLEAEEISLGFGCSGNLVGFFDRFAQQLWVFDS